MAIGAMSAAVRLGLTPGRDVLVAGFDGINLAQWVTPALTTYHQPIADIATAAVNKPLSLSTAQPQAAKQPSSPASSSFGNHLEAAMTDPILVLEHARKSFDPSPSSTT